MATARCAYAHMKSSLESIIHIIRCAEAVLLCRAPLCRGCSVACWVFGLGFRVWDWIFSVGRDRRALWNIFYVSVSGVDGILDEGATAVTVSVSGVDGILFQ